MCFKLKKFILTIELGGGSLTEETAKDCNTDVIAFIEEEGDNGELHKERYIASFFTYKNIETLSKDNKGLGSFLDGKYFFSKNMILIDNCNIENIRKVINHMIEEGEFKIVFEKVSPNYWIS